MGERLCPSCRKPLGEGAKFCTECGSRIDVDFTRKALDDDVSDGNGLIISKDIQSVNPFYSKPDKLKDGILNPVLKPLPEKKKVVFREWNPSADMEEEIGKLEVEVPEIEEVEPEIVVEEETQQEEIELSEEQAPIDEESEEEEPELIVEEVIEEQEPEPVVEEIEEEPQDFEEPVTEEIEEGLRLEIEKIIGEEQELAVEEVIEESEPEQEIVAEEIKEELPEAEAPEIEEAELEMIEEQEPEIIAEEQQNLEDARINYMISEIGEKLVDNLEDESMDNSEVKKENRIITMPVQGGFRKREPQAQEVKDINSFFTRRNKRR
jgi:hypothetical protein